MKYAGKNLALFLLFAITLTLPAEDLASLIKYLKLSREKAFREKRSFPMPEGRNSLPLKLIKIYRKTFSATDSPSCNFTVSCSEFARQAFMRFSFIHAFLMTSDRLQRCVRWSRRYYSLDRTTGLAVDFPQDWYFLGKKK